MTAASLILLTLRASIVLNVLALGLRAPLSDATYLARRPALLLKSLLSMDVAMPIAAVLLARSFDLHPAVKVALVALSISPVPPILPRKALKLGGREPYTVSLLVTAGVLSIVFIPVVLQMLAPIFQVDLQIAPTPIVKLVVITVVAPLAIGMAVRHVTPSIAHRAVKPVAILAAVLLVASALPILFTARSAIFALIGNGTLAAIAAFIVVGLLIGYALGGPDRADRTVLALASSSRHPGIALAIAHATFPEEKLATAAVGLYLIVNVLIGSVVSAWMKRRTPRRVTAAAETRAE